MFLKLVEDDDAMLGGEARPPCACHVGVGTEEGEVELELRGHGAILEMGCEPNTHGERKRVRPAPGRAQ
jgi:hypothetical protein